MNKKILITITIAITVIGLLLFIAGYFIINKNNFIQCLADSGVLIYGTKTCPACAGLAENFGGYEKIKPIYVDCAEEQERCAEEMKTNYVPEIQIKGEVYIGARDPKSIAEAVGCEI